MAVTVLIGCDRIVSRWVRERLEGFPEFGPHSTMGVIDGHRLIAGLIFRDYKGHDICIDIAADSPKWCTRRVLRAIFTYTYIQLGCGRVTGLQPASNTQAHRLVEGLGFVREGIMRCGYSADEDMWVYGLLKSECRWLNEQGQQAEGTENPRPERGRGRPDSDEHRHSAQRSCA